MLVKHFLIHKQHAIQTQREINSVGTKHSNEVASTAWVYYDLSPVLIHQLAVSSQVDEKKFAQSIYYYVRRSDKQQQSLQHFFSYLKEQGFHLHSLKKQDSFLA